MPMACAPTRRRGRARPDDAGGGPREILVAETLGTGGGGPRISRTGSFRWFPLVKDGRRQRCRNIGRIGIGGGSALSATLLTAWRLKRAVLAWRATLPKWQSGNNQAPEAGVRGCDPPRLERRLRHGHNTNERRETTRGKMAAPPSLPSCGPEEKAANSWVRGSRSISFSEQRAPGLAAVRIDG
jgi:hypothetical protein